MTKRTLTETRYEDRENYTTTLNATTDGLYAVPKRRLKKMVVSDGTGGGFNINFKDKPQKTVGP